MNNPFNTWLSSLREVAPAAAGQGIFYEPDYRFTSFGNASYGLHVESNTRFSLPSWGGMPGVLQVGSSTYSMPGGRVSSSGKIKSTLQVYYDELKAATRDPSKYVNQAIRNNPDIDFGSVVRIGKNYYNEIEGIKVASKMMLDQSKSTLTSSLGADYTLAFQRSHMLDINAVPVTVAGQTMSVKDHLAHLQRLQSGYNRGGMGLASQQNDIQAYYQEMVSQIEGAELGGQRVYISSVKDKLFREHGVVSTLGVHDITFHGTKKAMGKGLHHYAKTLAVDVSRLTAGGFTLPATSGAAFGRERAFVSKLANMGMQPGMAADHTTRFGATTFFAMGQRKGGRLLPSELLADSRSIAGYEMAQLTHGMFSEEAARTPMAGTKRKIIQFGGLNDIRGIKVHSHLKGDIVSILGGDVPKGMYLTEAGDYRYLDPKTIYSRQRRGYNPKRPYRISNYLGRHVPYGVQGPMNVEDVKMGLVGSDVRPYGDASQMVHPGTEILGYRPVGKGRGGIEIIYADSSRHYLDNEMFEKPMIVGQRRVMQRQIKQKLATTTGQRIHQIVRAQEYGLDKAVSSDFLSQYLNHIAHSAKNSGKLNELAGFINKYGGGGLAVSGSGSGQYLHLKNAQAGMGRNLFRNVQAVLKATNSQMAALGITDQDRNILRLGPQGIHLNQAAIRTMNVAGEILEGIALHGTETIYRTGTASTLKIGHGAMSMRMHDMLELVEQQMSAIDPKSGVGRAYGGFYDAVRKSILMGRSGRIGTMDATLPWAAEELANIGRAVGGAEIAEGSLIRGIKATSKPVTLKNWVKGKTRALATNEAEAKAILKKGAMTQGMLEGTVHASDYRGELIALPKAMNFVIDPMGTQVQMTHIPLVSDRFLGASPHEGGKYLTSGGIRNLGLPRKKAMLAALMKEHGADFNAGRNTGGVTKLKGAMRDYMSALFMALPGKEGLIYHNLQGQPKASLYGEVVNLGSFRKDAGILDLALNPRAARDFLKNTDLSNKDIDLILRGKKDFFLGAGRHPLHQGANLGAMKLVVDSKMDPDKIGVSSTFMRVAKGDFDKDTIFGFALNGQQENLRRMHEQRVKVMSGYDTLVRKREEDILSDIARKLKAGEIATPSELQDAVSNSAMFKEIANRMGSAAGGGAFVGPVHMGWARMTALTSALHDKEADQWIHAIAKDAPQLAKQLESLRGDKGFLGKGGVLRETGIYGILKKGAAGFGKDNVSALEAMLQVGSGERSVDHLRSVLEAGFTHAQKIDQLELSEVTGYLKQRGVTDLADPKIPGLLADMMVGKGQGHEGIATVAKLRHYMKSHGISDPMYEAARGQVNQSTHPKYWASRVKTAFKSILGFDVTPAEKSSVAAANSASEMLTRTMAKEAEEAGETVLEAGQRAVASAGFFDSTMKGIDTMMSRFKETFSTRWGKATAIGAGIVAGVGALDMMFGADGNSQPEAPMFNPGGAPLPAQLPIDFIDQGIGTPTAESFAMRARAPGRIERPFAQRQTYMVSGSSEQDVDFSLLGGGHLGTMGGPPVSDGMIVDGSSRADMSYSIRDNLRRSF